MATLSEIIGSIVKDITTSQITADLTSLEYLEHYKKDAILQRMSVPRVSFKNMNMKMRFAVKDVSELKYNTAAIAKVETEWARHINDVILPELIATHSSKAETRKVYHAASKGVLRKIKRPPLDAETAITGNEKGFISKSTDYVADIIKRLPVNVKKDLPRLPQLRTKIKSILTESFAEKKISLKKIAIAKSATDMDVSILVDKESLSQLPSEEMHEIEVSFDMDYIRAEQEASDNGDAS